MTDRYFVEVRTGCVAIRDRTKINPDLKDLFEDDSVVKMEMGGVINKTCEHCGHTSVEFIRPDEEKVAEMKALCDQMNRLDYPPKS